MPLLVGLVVAMEMVQREGFGRALSVFGARPPADHSETTGFNGSGFTLCAASPSLLSQAAELARQALTIPTAASRVVGAHGNRRKQITVGESWLWSSRRAASP